MKLSRVQNIVANIRRRIFFLKSVNHVERFLKQLLRKKQHILIIQIGAHVGKTSNDPLYKFLRKSCCGFNKKFQMCTAILVEPDKYLFQKLVENYSGCSRLFFENVAIAERKGERDFFRISEKINLRELNLPSWFSQLGSLESDRIQKLCNNFGMDEERKKVVEGCITKDEVQCITFMDLIEKFEVKTLDLLQIDAEGYDYNIMKSINFSIIKPLAINYERELLYDKEDECRKLLVKNGYELFDFGRDTFAVLNNKQTVN